MKKDWAEKTTIASLARTRPHTNAGSDKGRSVSAPCQVLQAYAGQACE